jgi:hypothetical protein
VTEAANFSARLSGSVLSSDVISNQAWGKGDDEDVVLDECKSD